MSLSEELDTDADFSIEIPDLPMDEPLSTSDLAKLSTKQKPPTGEMICSMWMYIWKKIFITVKENEEEKTLMDICVYCS